MDMPANRDSGAGSLRVRFVRKGRPTRTRLALLSGSALVSAAFCVAVLATPALADGGTGGSGPNHPGGAGGTGFTGQAGTSPGTNGGGGGGGAGGGAGGAAARAPAPAAAEPVARWAAPTAKMERTRHSPPRPLAGAGAGAGAGITAMVPVRRR
jgi:hypothetical protein